MNHSQWLEQEFPALLSESNAVIQELIDQAKERTRRPRYFLNGIIILVLINALFVWILPTVVVAPYESWGEWALVIVIVLAANIINQKLENRLIRSKLKTLVNERGLKTS
ncbi:hypothetical protein MGA5115_02808 [Marinomonas gallaica]|uniref:Uncharacterized protein n=1 Tax=Marinomonas gallaica TaxID=1806667 RepID=A0A1C3JTV9_9GAMM|nr:hypothetical protein [Marinomonas gallaica]SBT18661.1 hypothetical protein MGA5115_02808 [Marinomonas gallaica]SBT21616.1 hypothetical protein MGA5116_02212 [Marinomonas gallaica]